MRFQGPLEAIQQFEECCRRGHLVDSDGLIQPPAMLSDWRIYIDGEKAREPRIPADNRDHLIQLYAPPPKCWGHVWTSVRVKPKLRLVRSA